jgi:hypothetical protein
MKGPTPREIPFTGVRLRFDSNKSFEDVLSAVLADVGDRPLLINEVADNSESWDSYKKQIESHIGLSGFSLFAMIDHGAWNKKVILTFRPFGPEKARRVCVTERRCYAYRHSFAKRESK